MKINSSYTSPNQGIISVDNNAGLAIIGTGTARSVGFNGFYSAFHVGSLITNNVTPSNPTTPVKWITVTDENGNFYNSPLYQ